MSDFDTLGDRIRSEAAQAARPGQMERLEGIADEVERLRRGAKELGRTIEQQCRMVLDATGLHHFIDEDGDGDWGAVWENLFDQCSKAREGTAVRSEVEALVHHWERIPALRRGTAAAEMRRALHRATTTPADRAPGTAEGGAS